ncbi:MAG: hypothetical protein IKR73_03770 [Oscillospiraceae bacterium]|nr:hypothetical protein [Oscillospiraceae bacterium]
MNENEKFERFLGVIRQRSEDKAKQLLSEAKAESESILAGAAKAAEDAAKRRMRDADRIDAGRDIHNMAQMENDVRRAEHMTRERLTDEMFEDIARRLEAYASTEGYRDRLLSAIAKEDMTGAELHLSPRDAALVEGAVADEEIRLGGYAIVYRDKGICIDDTFDLALASERESFSSRNIGEEVRA